jgi:uncharacterized BrkB/YihY/UPF0761 family membrane protein
MPPSDDPDHLGAGLPEGRIAGLRGQAKRAELRYRGLAADHPLWALPLTLAEQHTVRQGVLMASALAFRLFLWVVPVALITAAIGAGLAVSEDDNVSAAAKSAGLTGAARHEVVTALKEGHRSWVIALLFGIVLFVWASRNLARMLILIHAHAWQAPLPKPRQKDLFVTGLLIDGAWFLVLFLALAVRAFDDLIPGGVLIGLLVETAVMSGIWFLISTRLPNRRRDWIDLLPGSLVFGAGFSVLHVVSRVYLPGRLARSSELYGSLGVAVVILAWLLIISELVVGAAFMNCVFSEHRQRKA